jgi:branched-chain amino acid transport system substrate-binding protein
VKRAKSDESDKVVAQLEGHKFNDFFARNGEIRKQDHGLILDVHQVQVKPKTEAKEDGDYYKDIGKTPAADAFTPLSESKCKMSQ